MSGYAQGDQSAYAGYGYDGSGYGYSGEYGFYLGPRYSPAVYSPNINGYGFLYFGHQYFGPEYSVLFEDGHYANYRGSVYEGPRYIEPHYFTSSYSPAVYFLGYVRFGAYYDYVVYNSNYYLGSYSSYSGAYTSYLYNPDDGVSNGYAYSAYGYPAG